MWLVPWLRLTHSCYLGWVFSPCLSLSAESDGLGSLLLHQPRVCCQTIAFVVVVVVALLSSVFWSNRPASLRNATVGPGQSQRPSVNPEDYLQNNHKCTIITRSEILYTKKLQNSSYKPHYNTNLKSVAKLFPLLLNDFFSFEKRDNITSAHLISSRNKNKIYNLKRKRGHE